MRCISALRRVLSELQRSEPARVERSSGCQRQEHSEGGGQLPPPVQPAVAAAKVELPGNQTSGFSADAKSASVQVRKSRSTE